MQCPFDPKKKEKIVIHLIFLKIQPLMLRSMITANDRYSGNNRYSGIKSPDRFFHYSGRTEGSPFTIRNHPVKTQTFDFLHIFACNNSQMLFPCNIRLSLAYNHDKQILSGFL